MYHIPVERSILPVHIKQYLINKGHYIINSLSCCGDDLDIMESVCMNLEIPKVEAIGFMKDNFELVYFEYLEIVIDGMKKFFFTSFDGIVNICGPPISGKSLLCRELANAASIKYSSKYVHYIDCERSLVRAYHGRLLFAKDVLVYRPNTWYELVAVVNEIYFSIVNNSESTNAISLIIIDSISYLLRYNIIDFSGNIADSKKKKNQILCHLISTLSRINRETGIVIVVTNQTTTDISSGLIVPCLGKQYQEILNGVVHKYILL
jgi:hypothetical protein